MMIHGYNVIGAIDEETRCNHYHKEIDRIAIKFYCCKTYFPCYECHAEFGCEQPLVWPENLFSEKAILCGTCGTEISIMDYLHGGYNCPICVSAFNPSCSLHKHLYFEDKQK